MAPPSMPIEEQDHLVVALKQGRDDAFEQLYAALHGRIYNLAARVVGDTDDAADITQEVFIKAFTRIPVHRGELRLEPWLYRVAVNTCYDHLRRRTVRHAAPLDEVGEVADACDEFERSQMGSAISSALQKISPRYRTALVLKELHGFGNAEVAEALGVSQGATNVLLFRARSAFKRALQEVSPAGSGGLTAMGLAAYLPNLPVPEALQAAPDLSALAPLAASLAPTAAPLATAILPAAEAGGSLAASAGILAKIGGAVGVKMAVGVLGVAALAGGSIAAHQAQTRDTAPSPARTAAVATVPVTFTTPAGAGGATTADVERRRHLQGRQDVGRQGAAYGAAANDGGKNGQGAGQAGSGGGKKSGGSVGASAGSGRGAGSGHGAGTAAGSSAAPSMGGSGGAGGGGAPTANGAGSGATAPGDGAHAGESGGGSGSGSERSGADAP